MSQKSDKTRKLAGAYGSAAHLSKGGRLGPQVTFNADQNGQEDLSRREDITPGVDRHL